MKAQEARKLHYEKIMDKIRDAVKRDITRIFITDAMYDINKDKLIDDGYEIEESLDRNDLHDGYWVSWFKSTND